MSKEDFVKALKFLGTAYNKEFDQEQAEVWYNFLANYDYETFKVSIKEIIKTNKYLPSISEMVEICDKNKKHITFNILEIMKKDGYFKNIKEYEKATMWLEKGIIPEWFRKDMKKYYSLSLENKQLLLS